MDGEVFVVSELTIDVHEAPTGPLIRFNGTTEWALDSVEQEAMVWLPREGQLRDGARSARSAGWSRSGDGFAVVIERAGAEERHVDVDAERAYAARCSPSSHGSRGRLPRARGDRSAAGRPGQGDRDRDASSRRDQEPGHGSAW